MSGLYIDFFEFCAHRFIRSILQKNSVFGAFIYNFKALILKRKMGILYRR
jgi:hypothetical protein